MSLLRADKIANRFNNSGPIIVGPSTVSGNFTVTGILTALGIGVTNNVLVGGGLTTKFLTATNSASLFNSTLTGITTAGIITNATYFGDGVNLTGIVTEIQPGPGIQISPLSGKGKLTISANGVVVSGYSTNSGLATDVKGGTAGAVLYQVGPNDTAFTASGTAGEILQSQGTGTPVWTSLAAINVSYADSSGISTNLRGGSAGRIPYQSGQNQTAFLPIGPTGNLLLGQGTSAPNWIDPKANLDVRYARLSGISTSAIGGVVDTNSLKVTGITTLSGGNVVVDNDLRVTGVTTAANVVVTGVSTIATLKVGTGAGATVGVTTILDEDTFVSNSNEALATQQSIKAYVDAQVTAQDLDGTADTGTFVVDLDSQLLGVVGTTNEIYTIGSGQTVTVGLDTNVTIPNNLTVTNQTQLSGMTTISGLLDVNGVIDSQSLNVSGVTTLATLGVTGVSTAQFLEVTGVGTVATLGVTGVSTAQFLEVTGVSTIATLGVTGVTTTQSLQVIGVTTTGTLLVGGGSTTSIGATITTDGNAIFSGIVTASTLNVTGTSTLGFTTITDNLYVSGVSTLAGFSTFLSDVYISGIASVGAAITMYPTTGIVSATAFYGDGSNLTGVVGLVSVTNQIYVTPDGNDENDGYLISTAKRTVGSALTIAEASTVVRISAGNYSENNPIIIPEQVTLLGDSLREVSIIPQNPDEDLIYVANGSYVENMSFTGSLNEGKAIIAFNPNKPSYVTQGPYIRNCTNFISNSIGMKIDGAHVIGDTRAMNVDSYTQLNQGGIGVSISNEGYAQLVSIFTIYNDQSIVCINGGQCDLTNSNSSFGRLGLVADGIGPTNFIGTVTEFTSAGSNSFPIDISTETISVQNALYDASTGLTTVTTQKAHGYTKGMSINLAGLGFTCPAYPHTFSSGVTNSITNTGVSNRFSATTGTTYDPATGLLVLNIGSGHGQTADSEFTATTGTAYNPSTGILTVVTTGVHGMTTGDYVKIVEGSLRFTCAKDGNATNHDYPRATDPVNNKWKQVVVTNTTTFTMNIGKSSDTSLHTWVSAVANGILRANSLISIADGGVRFTCALDGNATNHDYPRSTDPASGKVLGVEAITTDTITLNIGKSSDTSTHTWISGVTDAIVARTKAASYTAVVGTTYDGPTGSLVLDVNTTHGLTAATALTAGSGTTYEPTTGLLTVVTTGAHGMTTGDLVKFDKQSLTFTCTSDGNTAQITYPRTTDPVFNKWKQVTVTNATTFTVFIGATTTGNYPHTWVSATAGGVKRANSLITLTDNSVSFTCTKDNNTSIRSYPAYTDPASCRILGVDAVTTDTITINVGPANLATFPDNFGRVFTVNEVTNTTTFKTYVGVSTLTHGYDSGGNTNTFTTLPYDGQVVYLDSIYNTIKGVNITSGGSGYTTAPTVTFSDPSESWGVKATGVARLTSGSVTSVDMISNGRGYTGTPTVTFTGSATGTPDVLPTYYVVSSATPVIGGITTVTFTQNVPYAVGVGTTVPFFKQSRVLASSQAFEYIGSGNTALTALPQRGGVAIPENEIVNKNGGLVIFTSTDQAGNFKIGEGVIINQLEGSITGDAYNRSLFANITPYILALGGDS